MKTKTPWRCAACGCVDTGTIKRAYYQAPICAWCKADHDRAGLRWCNAGRHAVPAVDWSPKAKRCRQCKARENAIHRDPWRNAEYLHTYYQANRQRILATQRRYYQANRQRILAHKKAYQCQTVLASMRGVQ